MACQWEACSSIWKASAHATDACDPIAARNEHICNVQCSSNSLEPCWSTIPTRLGVLVSIRIQSTHVLTNIPPGPCCCQATGLRIGCYLSQMYTSLDNKPQPYACLLHLKMIYGLRQTTDEPWSSYKYRHTATIASGVSLQVGSILLRAKTIYMPNERLAHDCLKVVTGLVT